jgi:hypothetical protein
MSGSSSNFKNLPWGLAEELLGGVEDVLRREGVGEHQALIVIMRPAGTNSQQVDHVTTAVDDKWLGHTLVELGVDLMGGPH